ncbi:class I SAM-dependent methyltransferase [Sphingomonas sp.]|uniref:class I SAM-dependent methyltransferase n=1 Tax=Sphingomonas sp. TaxID=28214 RepID=UPI001821625E|nr:class I SAM-dependent methyltransferase [Sphingomonas sp.]MBA3511823.1 class I SAM-dependent methyltransferase [Sphingomonas sp.]
MNSLPIALGAAAAAALLAFGGRAALRRTLRRARDDHRKRPALWNRFYALDWGETTTNNYGFAPAEGQHPQRFQHQMYRELLRLLKEKRPFGPQAEPLKLLEVSCGRGGGLNAFIAAAPGIFDATGLDVATSAIAFCRSTYGENDRLRFVEGSALDLPFPDGSFDVLLNVEASNDYGDRPRFFAEVARVLKPGGVFLYTDSFRAAQAEQMKRELAAAGFEADFTDITANVAEVCRLDSPRRRELIDRQAPLVGRLMFRRQLENYAAVEGSGKYRQFAERRRAYLMTAAVKR